LVTKVLKESKVIKVLKVLKVKLLYKAQMALQVL